MKDVEVRKLHLLTGKKVNHDQGKGAAAAEGHHLLLSEAIVIVEIENHPHQKELATSGDLHLLIEVVIAVGLPLPQTEPDIFAILHLPNVVGEVTDTKDIEIDHQKFHVKGEIDLTALMLSLLIGVPEENLDRRVLHFIRAAVVEALVHHVSQENQHRLNRLLAILPLNQLKAFTSTTDNNHNNRYHRMCWIVC